MTDVRVCPADGGDHDWQNRLVARVCGRRGSSGRVTVANCPKCRTARTVLESAEGVTVEDEPMPMDAR